MAATDHDWTKPAALAIPKEGYFELERGRYGPIFPRTPACYGFSIIAKVKGAARTRSARTARHRRSDRSEPECLAPLKLHYLRWVLFDIGGPALPVPGHLRHRLRQVHRGCGRSCSARPASPRSSSISRAFPRTGRRTRGVHQVRPRAPVPELPGIRRVPVRDRRRDQEGAAGEGGILRDARPDAVDTRSACRMLELDDIQHILLTRTPAMTGRYEFLSFDNPAGGRAWLAAMLDKVAVGRRCAAPPWTSRALGHVGVHVERPARARRRRGRRSPRSPRSFARGWRRAPRSSVTPATNHPDNWVGGLAGDDLHAIAILFARNDDGTARRYRASTTSWSPGVHGVRQSVAAWISNATPPFNYAHDHFGFRDRLSQPVIEGLRRRAHAGLGCAAEAGRVHPRLPGRRRAAGQSAAAGCTVPQR